MPQKNKQTKKQQFLLDAFCLQSHRNVGNVKVIKLGFSPKTSASVFKNRCKDSLSLW